jgi:hypothetical protein
MRIIAANMGKISRGGKGGTAWSAEKYLLTPLGIRQE